MLAYPWPGNVRELEHVISRAAVKLLSRGASRTQILTLEPEVLDLEGHGGYLATPDVPPPGEAASELLGSLREAVEACQRQSILKALELCADNWANAARRLDLDPSNLHKLARRLGLK